MINILLVDDHELIRSGITGLLNSELGMNIVGDASSGEAAIKLVEYLNPDVVLMDVNMPGIGGIEACRILCETNPKLNILMLTVHVDGGVPNQLMNLGAKGYLSKNCSQGELLEAIQRVSRGERYIGKDIVHSMGGAVIEGPSSPFDNLSFREMQVILLTLQGKDAHDISELLNIGIKTINTYRHRAFEKLSVRNDVELVSCAARYGLQSI